MLRDLARSRATTSATTVWRKGVQVRLDVTGAPIRPSDLEVGPLVNAEPEVFFEHEDENGNSSRSRGRQLQNAKAKAA